MSITLADIMTRSVVTLAPENSLKDAHDITRTRGIRHLPVVDPDNGQILGVVTQKAMISKVISLLTLYGNDALAQHEQQTSVKEIAVVDFKTVKADDDLLTTADFFLQNKHGCLLVVDDNQQLCGILTSSDFVKLSIRLIKQSDSSAG